VKIAESESCTDIIEIPLETDGNQLLVSNIQAQFPSCFGLRYRNPANLKSWRGIRRLGNVFLPPLKGWGDIVYIIVSNQEIKNGKKL
jgi:hypothetical protein